MISRQTVKNKEIEMQCHGAKQNWINHTCDKIDKLHIARVTQR